MENGAIGEEEKRLKKSIITNLEVQFVDEMHNQRFHSSFGGGTSEIVKYNRAMYPPTVSYPSTEPYYFSQGEVKLFGQTLARIRNFSLSISNNLEPRYYIQDNSVDRTPYEIQENRRVYAMTATIALPDSTAAATSTTANLFKELLLEGDYGTVASPNYKGFNILLTFTRGTSDTIVITIPPSAAATGGNAQGAIIRSAKHSIGAESPLQVPVDIMFRRLKIVCTDAVGVYA